MRLKSNIVWTEAWKKLVKFDSDDRIDKVAYVSPNANQVKCSSISKVVERLTVEGFFKPIVMQVWVICGSIE